MVEATISQRGNLRVSASGRFLEYADGTPFFYLGDTAWGLFHRLNREEASQYLVNRAKKGFTVIQASALAELEGIDVPNAYGEIPLFDHNPETPNDNYFRHVDYIVDIAQELGLVIGMLPTWGKYWKQASDESQCIFTVDNARSYGRFIGERYREKSIIWILGGDQNIECAEERAVIDAMAQGLAEGDGGQHLMTFHPRGPGRSSEFIHTADWLAFNMCQSSHGARDHDNGLFIADDYLLDPVKPTLDGEPRYEAIPVGFYYNNVNPCIRFDDYDVRQAAYWALLAGACGHTYGHNSIWQMWAPGRKPALWADIPWYEALDHPGAFQMGLVRKLFESRPFQLLRPDQAMILDGPQTGGAKIRAARAEDGSFAFIYSPRGESFTVDKRVFSSKRINEIWFDPRYGYTWRFHSTYNAAFQTYTPPTSGRGNDWILILENQS